MVGTSAFVQSPCCVVTMVILHMEKIMRYLNAEKKVFKSLYSSLVAELNDPIVQFTSIKQRYFTQRFPSERSSIYPSLVFSKVHRKNRTQLCMFIQNDLFFIYIRTPTHTNWNPRVWPRRFSTNDDKRLTEGKK